MATYAIGDIQGCGATLDALLGHIGFDPARDRLWCAGDVVNRGPDSLGVVRRLMGLGSRVTVTLGNHDLHLLGRVAGARGAKRGDTLDAVLAAPDRGAIVDWLRRQPVMHVEGVGDVPCGAAAGVEAGDGAAVGGAGGGRAGGG
ncbi:MAG: metallophosphoesterase [bacterium]